jgi:excisionase family DNA binding protein
MSDLLVKTEVAQELRCSTRTVERLVKRKKLKQVVLGHSTVRFRKIDVEKAKQNLETATL